MPTLRKQVEHQGTSAEHQDKRHGVLGHSHALTSYALRRRNVSRSIARTTGPKRRFRRPLAGAARPLNYLVIAGPRRAIRTLARPVPLRATGTTGLDALMPSARSRSDCYLTFATRRPPPKDTLGVAVEQAGRVQRRACCNARCQCPRMLDFTKTCQTAYNGDSLAPLVTALTNPLSYGIPRTASFRRESGHANSPGFGPCRTGFLNGAGILKAPRRPT